MEVAQILIPPEVKKYFWGDDLDTLSWETHQSYIEQTLLERGDQNAINWLFSHLSKAQIKSSFPRLKLSPKSANFWSIYLS